LELLGQEKEARCASRSGINSILLRMSVVGQIPHLVFINCPWLRVFFSQFLDGVLVPYDITFLVLLDSLHEVIFIPSFILELGILELLLFSAVVNCTRIDFGYSRVIIDKSVIVFKS